MKYALIALMALLSFNLKAQDSLCSKNHGSSFNDSVIIIVRTLFQTLPYIQSCEDLEKHARFIEYIDFSKSTDQLTTLEPLIYFRNLKYLNLSYQYSLSDIDQLGKIKKLTSLKMLNVPVDNFVWIKNLNRLEELSFAPGNQLNDLSPLTSLKILKTLEIRDGLLNSTLFLNSLNNLTELLLINTRLQQFEGEIPTSVETLDIRYNYFKNFNFIPTKSKLTFISADYNEIDDLSQLRKVPQLKTVYLNDNHVQDISPLSELNLDNLYPYRSDYLSSFLQRNPIETNPFNENFCPTKSKSRGVNWYCTNKMMQQRKP